MSKFLQNLHLISQNSTFKIFSTYDFFQPTSMVNEFKNNKYVNVKEMYELPRPHHTAKFFQLHRQQ